MTPASDAASRVSRRASAQASFAYMAATPTGSKTFGMRVARDERTLASGLQRERLFLVRAWRLPAFLTPEKGLGMRDVADLNEQLAQLLSRGVPLVEALEVVEQTVRPVARPTVQRVRELVSGGASLADACEQQGVFDLVTTAVYRAAERTGDLAGAAAQLAQTVRRQLAVASKAITLMIYPMVVISISMIVVFIMLTVIVPGIASSLAGLGIELPWYSKITVGLGTFLRDYIVIVVPVILGAIAAVIVMRSQVGRAFKMFSRKLPLFRDVALAQESARFFSVMAALTRSGVPLADALGVGVQALSHPTLKGELSTLQKRLVEGGVLRTLIEQVESLPLATRRLLIAADRSGDLETAFDSLANDTAALVDQRTARLLAAMEPVLIVVMFLVIGGMLLSIMIPLMNASMQTIG